MKDGLHTTWRKSSYSTQEGGQCVEMATLDRSIGIRDSTDPLGPMLRFGRDSLADLLNRIKTRDIDRLPPSIVYSPPASNCGEPMENEPHATWRKSSYTSQEGGTCVELAKLNATVGIRDSTDPNGPVLKVGRNAVASLLDRIKTGELDR